MYVVVVWLDVFNLWNVDWCDVVRCLDVKPCKVKKNGFRFAKMFCDVFSCHLCDGSRTDIVTASRFGVGD